MNEAEKLINRLFGKDNQQEETKQLRQQLEQAQTRIKELEDKDWYEATIKQLEEQNDRLIQERDNLKQQLAEKDNLIEFGREEIRKRNKRIDEIVERDKKLFDNKNKELEKLKQQLAEKDKEIERFMSMKNKEQLVNENEALKDTIAIVLAQKRNIVKHKKQLAIQELEKVKIELKNKICLMQNTEHCYSQRFISWYEMCDLINNQIKELKK